MINKKYKRLLKYLVVLIWMVVIFSFSKDPAQVSDAKSGFVIKTLTSLGLDLNNMFGQMANFIIRKMGHFTEYFILCALLIIALKNEVKSNKKYVISIAITFLYACSDEIHQLFVPGRSGRVTDVLIDTVGGILAIVILKWMCKMKSKM